MGNFEKSIRWLRSIFNIKIKQETPQQNTKKNSNDNPRDNSISPGNLYVFIYDPKTKETLSYYDKFPVIILLKMQTGGFLGLNLHYLPPKYRIQFLYKLMPYATVDNDGNIKKLELTYGLLQATSKLNEFKPCLKRYLFSHVVSPLYRVPVNEWEMVLALPSDNFEKATAAAIWADSMHKMNN
jgi:hypothetical protein